MLTLDFDQQWVNIIVLCVTIVRYSVIVNDKIVGPIISGGLIQGNPLSPYLFLLCAEDLIGLVQDSEKRGLVHECKVCRGAPIILN